MSDPTLPPVGARDEVADAGATPPTPVAEPPARDDALGEAQLEAVSGGVDGFDNLAEACYDWARRTFGPTLSK